MTWRVLFGVGFGLCWACAGQQPKRLEDGSYLVRCNGLMERCLEQAAETCGSDGYSILEGSSREEAYGGYNYQTGIERHELVVRCRGSDPLAESAPSAGSADGPQNPPRPASVCTPGATQRCVGPGACTGGQACLPDGSGFAACDCGPQSGVAKSATVDRVDPQDASGSAPDAGAERDADSTR